MLEYFEGPAGAGKTFRLLQALEGHLSHTPLEEGQRVLGLSFMHGARRRLSNKLAENAAVGRRFECSTIDSFARLLANRWRSLGLPSDLTESPEPDPFKQTLSRASYAASHEHVRRWVGWSFPVVLVDEFQDCSEGHIELVSAIEPETTILSAADGFQHLNDEDDNLAVRYLENAGSCTRLTGNYRTSARGLLETSRLARQGEPVAPPFNRQEKGIWIQPTWKYTQAAVAAARSLQWYRGNHAAILSPVGPEKATFVRNTVDRLKSKKLVIDKNKGLTAGPFRIRWTASHTGRLALELANLGLTDPTGRTSLLSLQEVAALESSSGRRILLQHLQRRLRLRGSDTVTIAAAKDVLKEGLSALASRSPAETSGIEAMTIHQAKNREFDSVIVLWPVQTGGSLSYQRRLLYNAITRARSRACVLIQDPKGTRLDRELERELFGLNYR